VILSPRAQMRSKSMLRAEYLSVSYGSDPDPDIDSEPCTVKPAQQN